MSEPSDPPGSAASNPYAPATQSAEFAGEIGALSIAEHRKVEAIIKDANQFWLAILICFLCSALGIVLIAPWYLVRLTQWNNFARSHAKLLEANAVPGSLAQRFQSAKWKLMVGLIVGGCLFLLMSALLAITVMLDPQLAAGPP